MASRTLYTARVTGMMRSWGRAPAPWLLLAAILGIAIWWRLQGLGFGLPALYDPDEPLFGLTAVRLLRERTLNPGWFGHPGTTTIYALALVDILVYFVGHATGRFPDVAAFAQAIYRDPGVLVLPGRTFILLCGVATIALAFVLARRLFGDRVALLAAVLLAVDPVHIRYSQIIRTDMHSTVFLLLALIAAVAIARCGRRAAFVWAGVWIGVACATKWPSALGLVSIAGACGLRIARHPDERGTQIANLALAGVCALVALFVSSPYLLLDYSTALANFGGEVRKHHLGATGYGPIGNAVWYLAHPLRSAFGLAGLALVLPGIVIAARRERIFAATIVPLIVVVFVAISLQSLIWERWVVPLLPVLSIAAAVTIDALIGRVRTIANGPVSVGIGAAATLLVVVPASASARADAIERAHDTRRAASAWAMRHIPRGSTLVVEHLAFDLLGQGWRFVYPAGDAGCVDVAAMLQGRVQYSTIGTLRNGRAIIDLGTIDPARLDTCRADYAILVNYDRYRRERALYPAELATYAALLRGGTIVRTIVPERGKMGGPVVRIVRLAPRDSRRPAPNPDTGAD